MYERCCWRSELWMQAVLSLEVEEGEKHEWEANVDKTICKRRREDDWWRISTVGGEGDSGC